MDNILNLIQKRRTYQLPKPTDCAPPPMPFDPQSPKMPQSMLMTVSGFVCIYYQQLCSDFPKLVAPFTCEKF